MKYHSGYDRLTEVAVENAADVCPDGKEGLMTSIFLVISAYFSKGRSRFMLYFKAVEIPKVTAEAAAITHASLNKSLSSLINAAAAIPAGIPAEIKISEPEINLEKSSTARSSGKLRVRSASISIFWAESPEVKRRLNKNTIA